MKIWPILCFASLTVLSVFLLAVGWEFGIEEIAETRLGIGEDTETVRDHWEFVFTSTFFATLALIVPILMALKIGAPRQQAQDEIAHTAHILKTTFDHMSRGIVVRDADLNIIAFNQRYVDLLDYPPDFIRLGMGFEEISRFKTERGDFGDGDPEELVRERRAIWNLKKPDFKEITTARGIVLAKRREPLPGGGYVTTFTDITERKRAEEVVRESRERLAGILDIADDAVISMDEDHRIILFNKGAERTFGYEAEEVLGEPIEMLLPAEFREEHRHHVDNFAEGSTAARLMGERREIFGRRKDGERFPGEASISRLDLNGKRVFTVILRDITERKRAEAEIAEKSAILEMTFQSMSQGISVLDTDLNLIAFNQKYVELWDFPPGFIRLGMPCDEVARFRAERGDYGPGDVEEHVRARGEAKERSEPISKELTIPNGTIIALEADPMPGGGYVSTHTDITARKAVEREIGEKSAILETTFQSMTQGISVFDTDLNLIAFNQKYVELWDFPPGFIRLGMPCDEICRFRAERGDYGPGDVEEQVQARGEAEERCEPISKELTIPNGTIVALETDPMPGGGYVSTHTDITMRKAVEREIAEKSALLETTFETMNQGITVYDADNRLVAFNQKFVKLLNFPPDFVRIGKPFEEFIRFNAERGDYGSGDVEEFVREYVGAMDRGKIISRERTRPDGTVLSIRRDPMPDGGHVTTFSDITKRKKAEAALRQSEANLKGHVIELEAAKSQSEAQGVELAGLAENLAVARDQAEGANRAKSDFLALMSHELRTPLNAIIGFSEIIKRQMMGPIGNPKYGEYASDVFDSAQHLLGLINDILDLSKIEAGKMAIEEEDVDVAGVIHSCLRLVTERAAKGGVKLVTEVPDDLPALRIDERKLKQILLNLLSNAVKFTPDGGTITVKTWFKPDSGFVLQVADTGVGIALEDIPKALAPFGQVDSTLSRKYEGTGLGLPLTKSLVEMSSGSLDLQSGVGAGTTVTVRFPPERAVATPAETPATPRSLSTA